MARHEEGRNGGVDLQQPKRRLPSESDHRAQPAYQERHFPARKLENNIDMFFRCQRANVIARHLLLLSLHHDNPKGCLIAVSLSRHFVAEFCFGAKESTFVC